MVKKNHINFPSGVTVVTPFILVYGTLRKGGGNYKRLLTDTLHVGTYKLPGWALHSIFIGYSGSKKHYTVVDLFDIRKRAAGIERTDLELYELNYQLDSLEGVLRYGNYTSTYMLVTVDKTVLPVKIYNANLDWKSVKLQHDFMSDYHIDYPELEVHEIPTI